MRPAFSVTALVAALLVHAAMLVAVNWITPADQPAVPLPVSMSIELLPPAVPTAPAQARSVPPVPAPAPQPKPPKLTPRPKPARTTPAAKPVPDTAEPRPAAVSVPPTQDSAQEAAPPNPTPAPTPVATAVYISANYAARNRPPEYPALSKRYGEQGTVRLRVLVQADGSAGKVEIERSSGYALLDEAARNAVRNWRFQPATKDGKPVADWYLTPVVFKLEN